MSHTIELPWGADSLSVPLPKSWNVLGTLGPATVPSPDNVADACTDALANHLALFSDSPKLPEDFGRKMGLCRSFRTVEEMIVWTAGKVPKSATVRVMPYGGSTFARHNRG